MRRRRRMVNYAALWSICDHISLLVLPSVLCPLRQLARTEEDRLIETLSGYEYYCHNTTLLMCPRIYSLHNPCYHLHYTNCCNMQHNFWEKKPCRWQMLSKERRKSCFKFKINLWQGLENQGEDGRISVLFVGRGLHPHPLGLRSENKQSSNVFDQ